MPKIVTIAQMQALETAAIDQGLPAHAMLSNAGTALAQLIATHFGELAGKQVLVLAGAGNNGGDGLVAAQHLCQSGAQVKVYLSRALPPENPLLLQVRAAGAFVVDHESDQRCRVLSSLLRGTTILLDALVGIGGRPPLREPVRAILQQVKLHLPPTAHVVAVDCPSGYDCDSGTADPATLAADLTVTFGAYKIGLLAASGEQLLGDVLLAPIGWEKLPDWQAQPDWQSLPDWLDASSMAHSLPVRSRFAHKGSFGRVLVVAGSLNYAGAAYLAAAGAYRAGAGLVTLASVPAVHASLLAHLPEAIWLPLNQDLGAIATAAAPTVRQAAATAQAVLLGPGLGQAAATAAFVDALFSHTDRAVGGRFGFLAPQPTVEPLATLASAWVVDADGLTLLAKHANWWQLLPAGSVLTPHPGEFATLTGLARDAVQAERLAVASQFAQQWGHVVVLKGAHTVIAAPNGKVAVAPFATAALATAGTGDVLAGVIAGLRAQGLDGYTAACLGVYLHGSAGEWAAEKQGSTFGVLASDVLNALPAAFRQLSSVGR